ncbi:MAG TPA: hypothetical protein VFN57_16025 [Thermomicrobiaceae bacterium]|nr:hypothetical protein [Thermomicrobiaceae bacterium]
MTRWRRALVFASAALLVVAAAATTVSGVAAAPASSTAQYTIFTFNRVPILNDIEVGTLTATLTGTSGAFSVAWSFRGTVNGSPASATGTGSGSGDANNITLNLDTISSWSMDGFPQPETGKTAYLTRSEFPYSFFSSTYTLSLTDVANFGPFYDIVAGLPLLVFPQFNGPFASPYNFLFESSLGGGATNVSTLPGATSVGPAHF